MIYLFMWYYCVTLKESVTFWVLHCHSSEGCCSNSLQFLLWRWSTHHGDNSVSVYAYCVVFINSYCRLRSCEQELDQWETMLFVPTWSETVQSKWILNIVKYILLNIFITGEYYRFFGFKPIITIHMLFFYFFYLLIFLCVWPGHARV